MSKGVQNLIFSRYNIMARGTRRVKRKGAQKVGGKWSLKYKKSINCNRPKGFSQKQHCRYRNKNTRKNNK